MRPNVVFILVDDMGYGDFGRFNDGRTQTPYIDALVDQGVTLTQEYTASPVCNPSRATILTGRYPQRTGSVDTLEWRGLERLALRERTLADVYQQAGYRTGLVGKWHLGAFDNRYAANARGFDESVCFRGGMHDYYDWRIEYDGRPETADGRYLTDVWTEEACRFIDRHRSEPFFLHVTYNAPHTPLQCPDEDVAPFLGDARWNRGVSILYGMIRRMDAGVGRILEAIDKAGIRDNTILVFTSDNGPQFGGADPDMRLDRFNCNFHGHKGNVYDGGVRVPMMIRWPDGLDAGRTVDDMSHVADMYPTLLNLCGLEVPADNPALDGVDITPMLRGERGKLDTRRCWAWNRYAPQCTWNAAIRDGDWKLVRPPAPESGRITDQDSEWLRVSMYETEYFIENGVIQEPWPEPFLPDTPPEPELYNIAADPGETENLATTEPDRVRCLGNALDDWFADVMVDFNSIDDQW